MKNSLINESFKNAKKENRPALLTYTVAGDNTKIKSLEILKSISKYADICELGFPHNTPIADGGQIQTSSYRAIKNGIRINDVFSIVKAFKKINDNDVFLIIVGSIEDKSLKNLFKKKNKILHINYTNSPEDFFSMANVLCLPSHREGFGTVVIEAASCGLPTLASKIYGLYDSISENKTGFFHKAYDVDDIKDQMLYVINNKKLVKRYGNSAKIRVAKDFNNKLLAKKLLKFIKLKIR